MVKSDKVNIGNWLLFEDKPVQVEAIDPLKKFQEKEVSITIKQIIAGYHIGYDARWLNDFDPIPLSDEILEKCGFKKCTCGGYRLGVVHLDKDMRAGKSVPMVYLHQLQNIFWCLCGTELNIQL